MLIALPEPRIIRTAAEAYALLPTLLNQTEVSVDTETEGSHPGKGPHSAVDRMRAIVDCWSLSFHEEGMPLNTNRYVLPRRALYWLEDFFLAEHVDKIFHNAGFDLAMLANSGVPEVRGRIHCGLVLDSLIDENRFGNHGLKECAWDYMGLHMQSFKDTFQGRKLSSMSIEEKADYASEDTWATHILFTQHLRPLAQEEVLGMNGDKPYTLWDLYERYYPAYIRLMFRLQRRGWRVDTEYLKTLEPLIQSDIDRIDFLFNKYASEAALNQGMALHEYMWERGVKHKKIVPVFPGGIINPGSNDQVIHFFTKVLGLPVLAWTDGGKSGKKRPRLDEDTLKQYKTQGCNYAGLLLQRRNLSKILGTYVRGLLKWEHHGKIHASLKIMGARTGRLSCSDPNLQNIPKPDNDAYQIRRAFIADPGYTLIVIDYSTLEMRILASISKCPDLCQAINSGMDLHCLTASRMFGIPYADLWWAKENERNMDLSMEDRRRVKDLLKKRSEAKAIGFGIVYGRGAPSLADTLECSIPDAEAKINAFFAVYPGVKYWIDNTIEECRITEAVRTWLLRKRRLISINSPDRRASSEAERQAMNAPIQGTNADMMMIMMLMLEEDKQLKDWNIEMLMQVHDEIIFHCPDEYVEIAEPYIIGKMEEPWGPHFSVPIKADGDSAKSWADAK